MCKLCWTNDEDYALQVCGHKCCRECLGRMFGMFARPDADTVFPMCCPVDSSCRQNVCLQDLLTCCTRAELEGICRQSTTKMIERGGVYRFCPSPTCNGVLGDSAPEQGHKVCYTCMGAFCTACSSASDNIRGVPWHSGLTCAQFTAAQGDGGTELLKEYLRNSGGQQCGRCKTFVIRNGGCDHMTCKCGHNFCYQCGNPSSRSSCSRPCR
jgi:E3 ubiquitin-protein ligase RNF144